MNLGKWITSKFGTKGEFASKIGADPTLISRWMRGAGISDTYQAKIRKLGYTGPWPSEEAKEAPAEFTSREDHWKLVGRVETLERALERLGEIVRSALPGSGESHPRGRT